MQLTSTILVAQVREPPDVSQSDGVTNTREDELELAAPGRSLLVLLGDRLVLLALKSNKIKLSTLYNIIEKHCPNMPSNYWYMYIVYSDYISRQKFLMSALNQDSYLQSQLACALPLFNRVNIHSIKRNARNFSRF